MAVAVGLTMMAGARPGFAGPEGGQIVAGSGSISRPDAVSTLIHQSSERLGINWESFNVGENESVRFLQPSSSSVALNRILDQNPSSILGALDANGHVYLINPNGIVFGETARINVAALIASSLDISVADFMAGNLTFEALAEPGAVINRGLIQAATGGSVTLLGGSVSNEGLIVAELGQVNLGAGTRATLDFDGDGLIYFEIDQGLLTNTTGAESAVSNSGEINAPGGHVLLTASAARDVFSNVVNHDGVIRASRIEESGGVVRLVGDGGTVRTSGLIDASSESGTGGTVQVLGDRVGLFDGAVVDVSGGSGGGLAQIGGGFQGSDPNVRNAERTYVGADARITADAGATGDGGTVIVWADEVTRFNGEISARGGATAGDGGFVEVSGKDSLVYRGNVDTGAANGKTGTLLLDPSHIIIQGGTGGADDGQIVDDGTIAFDDGDDTFTISEAALETTESNILLQARDFITASGTFDHDVAGEGVGVVLIRPDLDLTLETRNGPNDSFGGDFLPGIDLLRSNHGSDLTFRTQRSAEGAGGSITMTAGTQAAEGDEVDPYGYLYVGSLITDGNDITLTAEAGISLQGLIDAGTGTVNVKVTEPYAFAFESESFVEVNDAIVAGRASLAGNGSRLTAGIGDDEFIVTGSGTGTLNGASFAGFFRLEGSDGNDTFRILDQFTGGSLFGDSGDDVFDIQSGQFDFASGGEGNDVFNIHGSGFVYLGGGEGDDLFTIHPGILLSAGEGIPVYGDSGNDVLDLSNLSEQIQVRLSGAIFDGFYGFESTAGVDFVGFETLIGNSLGSLTGLDTDSIWTETSYSALQQTLTFRDFAVAIAAGEGAQTLRGSGLFTITGPGEVALNGQAFQGIDGLDVVSGSVFELLGDFGIDIIGSNDDDTFVLRAAQSRAIDGGLGIDTLDLSGVGADVEVELSFAEVEVGFSGVVPTLFTGEGSSFHGIDSIIGNGSSTLTGPSFTNGIWTQSTYGLGNAVLSFSDFALLRGGVDAFDELTGSGVFDITGPGAVRLNGQAFAEMDTIQALSSSTFNFLGNFDGRVQGSAGADTFNILASHSGGIDGGAGDDEFFLAEDVVTGFGGGPGRNTMQLLGLQPATVFASSDGAGFVGTEAGGQMSFSGVSRIVGHDGGVTFDIDGEWSGELWGGAGNDVFNLNFDITGSLFGAAGDDTFNLRAGVSLVDGGAGNDTFDLDVSGRASTLFGGSGNDVFLLRGEADTVDGGAGNDLFNVFFDSLIGTVIGGDGDDTFDLSGSVGTARGGAGNDIFNILAAIESTVDGEAGDDTFVLDANQFGTLLGGDGNDTYRLNVSQTAGTLDGGAGDDRFVLASGVTFFGNSMTGSAGTDELDLSEQAGAVEVNLGSVGPTGFSGSVSDIATFGSMSVVRGSGSSSDVLRAPDGSNSWTIDGLNQGVLQTNDILLRFIGFEDLVGGAGADAFLVSGTGSLSGRIDGVAGGDSLTGNSTANTWTLTGAHAGRVENADGNVAFVNIPTVIGGAAADVFNLDANFEGTVDGGDGADVFNVNTAQTGPLRGGAGQDHFRLNAAVASVFGGADGDRFDLFVDAVGPVRGEGGDDEFRIEAAQTGELLGNGGNDTFIVNVEQAAGRLDGGVGNDRFVLNADTTGEIVAGDGDDRFEIQAAITASLSGDAGNDTFVFNAASTGSVSGGDGDDRFEIAFDVTGPLSGDAGNDTFVFNAASSGPVSGGDGDDRFELSADVTGLLSGDAGNDEFVFLQSVTVNIDAGADDDRFVLENGVVVNGTVDGGTGSDLIDFSRYATPRSVVLADISANGFTIQEASLGQPFVNIDALLGPAGVVNTLTGMDHDAKWVIAGDAGNTYTVYADEERTLTFWNFGRLVGGAGADAFHLGGDADETVPLAKLKAPAFAPGGSSGGTVMQATTPIDGQLELIGGDGADTATAVGVLVVDGNLDLSAIEAVHAETGSTIVARTLTIQGAEGGIGSEDNPLVTSVDAIEIIGAQGSVIIVEQDALTALGIEVANGELHLTVQNGDLTVGNVKVGDPSDPSSGFSKFVVEKGSLFGTGPGQITGGTAAIEVAGVVGTANTPIIFALAPDGTIVIEAITAYIHNLNLTNVDFRALDPFAPGAGVFDPVDLGNAATSNAITAAREVALIDWAGFDPTVALVDCNDPCVRLPEDQVEERSFADGDVREPTRMLLVWTRDGWKLVPVFEVAALR